MVFVNTKYLTNKTCRLRQRLQNNTTYHTPACIYTHSFVSATGVDHQWLQPCISNTPTRMGSGGRAVERRTVNRGDGGSIPPTAVSKLGNFFTPHLPVSFGRDTKSRWSLLSGVYARGSKRSHTGGKCVTCSGLTNSTEEQLLR